ncbi:MAG: twin-arginine translocase subunit TatC [Halorientalis sp.]
MSDGEPGLYSEMDIEGPDRPEPDPTPGGEPPDHGTGAGTPGAPDDEEMPLTEHIEEMVRRLGVVVLALTVVGGLAFPFADRLITFLWFSFLPGAPSGCPPPTGATASACPRVYHPLSLMIARLKVSALVGFIAALPIFVYETYLFMRPGLYPRERKYYLAAVPTSLILAAVGIAVAFFLVLPAIFTYFLYYSESAAVIAFGLSETFNLMVMMLGLFAFIFQIPLFVMLAIMMGVTTRRWLEARRLYFWGGFLTLAFFFSPDPTGMAPFLVASTMVVLFEGTLGLLRWTGTDSRTAAVDQVAALRPLVYTVVAAVAYVVSPAPMPTGYYGRLPQVVIDGLAYVNLASATPIIVGLAVIAAFEGLDRLVGRVTDAVRVRRLLARARVPVWLGAVVVGYLASPDPGLLRRIDVTYLSTAETAVAVVAALALYEGGLVLWRWRRGR